MTKVLRHTASLRAFIGLCLFTINAVSPLNAAMRDEPPISGRTPIVIQGVIIAPPPCVINNGETIEIDFGAVLTTRIDGVRYRQPVDYQATCENMPHPLLTLSLIGTPSEFNHDYLTTSIDGLAVSFHANGQSLPLGQTLNFTFPDFPKLEATPIKDAAVELPGREFVTSATLEIAYQ